MGLLRHTYIAKHSHLTTVAVEGPGKGVGVQTGGMDRGQGQGVRGGVQGQ